MMKAILGVKGVYHGSLQPSNSRDGPSRPATNVAMRGRSIFRSTVRPLLTRLISKDGMEPPMKVVGYEISTDRDRIDVEIVFKFLSEESYWCPGISRAVVEKSIDKSLCFGAYQGETQVGFARIVTDTATFALVADVFVLEPHRGKGLSKWLMQEVIGHPDLQGLRRLLLLTSDAHSLYAQFGFTEIRNAWRSMELLRTDVQERP